MTAFFCVCRFEMQTCTLWKSSLTVNLNKCTGKPGWQFSCLHFALVHCWETGVSKPKHPWASSFMFRQVLWWSAIIFHHSVIFLSWCVKQMYRLNKGLCVCGFFWKPYGNRLQIPMVSEPHLAGAAVLTLSVAAVHIWGQINHSENVRFQFDKPGARKAIGAVTCGH